jgi:predicted O-methyltransferase YrrM
MRVGFLTVTDVAFFPGTLATVNSVRHFHPNAEIHVVIDRNLPLTAPQVACLESVEGIRLTDASAFERSGRPLNAWELKAYAACDLSGEFDVLVGIDSDCVLCSNVDDIVARCRATGGFIGGQDGVGAGYDDSYEIYGIQTPAHNPKYMSTSLYFCAVNERNGLSLKRWADCCSAAEFNGAGPYPGHGDQGVLNALLFADRRTEDIELLENRLWSQHWCYWDSTIDFRASEFINHSADGRRQRSFHCGGTEKFWSTAHRDRILDQHALQTYPYVWFLAMLWFGECGDWSVDPCQWLAPESHHLIADLVHFLPQIMQVFPPAGARWSGLSDPMIDRILNGVRRAMSLGGGSMSEVIALVADNPHIRRYAEIGSYEGGSLLTLALRFLNRDCDFYAVESFMGNLNGTMDGHRLPSRKQFIENLGRYPGLRARLIPGDSAHAAALFDDASLDFVFIDACHDTCAVLRDIERWLPKVAPGGFIAGDDYDWDSVRDAVRQKFPEACVTPSGTVWWLRR